MQSFLVEVYQPAASETEYRAAIGRLRAAAKALTWEGAPVTYRRSIFVPLDDTCFHLLEAVSFEAVAEVARRAAMRAPRVVEVLDVKTGAGVVEATKERTP
jgi:hypothetical protein